MPYLDFSMRNIHYTNHFHEEIELMYVKNGKILLTLENKTTELSDGETAIILPGEIHSYRSITPNMSYIFKINDATSTFKKLRLKDNKISADNKHFGYFTNTIEEVFREFESKETGFEIAISVKLNGVLLEILRNMEYYFIENTENKKLSQRLVFLDKINGFIEENYENPIQLADIAKYTGFSVFYFSHYFKDSFGKTFFEYLSIYRLDKAINLMMMTDEKITSAAFSCGFNNIRSFNRLFKKHYGMTPSEYKKKALD